MRLFSAAYGTGGFNGSSMTMLPCVPTGVRCTVYQIP